MRERIRGLKTPSKHPIKDFIGDIIGVSTVIILIVLLAVSVLGGCSLISSNAKPIIAPAVAGYCGLPAADRELLHSETAAIIAPHTIVITCKGDD